MLGPVMRYKNDMFVISAISRGGLLSRTLTCLRMRKAVQKARKRRRENAQRLNAPVPRAISLSVTTRCQQTCTFCAAPQTQSGSDLSESLAMRIAAEAEELGVFTVILVGGEPLLCEDLVFSLVSAHPKMFFLLFTGTTDLTEETARKANMSNLLTLVATEGNGDRGQPARQALCQSGAAFGFSTVVSGACSDELSSLEFATAMAKDGCRMGIFLERLPVGRAAKLGYGLSNTSRPVFRDRLSSAERKSGLPLRFFPDDEDNWGGCAAAGRDLLHINADGGVEPCPFIHEAVEDLNNYVN